MKIAYFHPVVIPAHTANGVQVMKMCQALAQEGYDLSLYVIRGRDAIDESIWKHYGIEHKFPINPIKINPRLRFYDYTILSIYYAKKSRADYIFTRYSLVAAFSSILGMPTILELHNIPQGSEKLFLKLFLRGRGFHKLVSITHALWEIISDQYAGILNPHKHIVAPDGIDLERFNQLPEASAARQSLGWPDKPTVGYAGSLYVGRGIELLISIAARLPEVNFKIMGGKTNDLDIWRNHLAEKGIVNVSLLGFVPNQDLPLFLAACDILLMPYQARIENSGGRDTSHIFSPMKLFEYMAVKRPVISSDLKVLREIIDETNALFCAPDNVDEWVMTIRRAMSDAALRTRLAHQAWQDVQQYTWKKRARRCVESK